MKARIRVDRLHIVGIDERTVRQALARLDVELAGRVHACHWKATSVRALQANARSVTPSHVARAIADALLRSAI